MPTVLQTGPFGHSGNLPAKKNCSRVPAAELIGSCYDAKQRLPQLHDCPRMQRPPAPCLHLTVDSHLARLDDLSGDCPRIHGTCNLQELTELDVSRYLNVVHAGHATVRSARR